MSCASSSLVAPHPRASVALRLERRRITSRLASSSSPSGSDARLGVVAFAGERPCDRVLDRDALVAIQSAFERPAVALKDGATVTLRPMRESDVRALTAVMVDAFRGTPDERPRARVAKYLLDQLDPDPDEICLVAVLDDAPDEPIAIASLSFSESARGGPPARGSPQANAPTPPDAPYLCNMAVANEHRGRGVAKALLAACDHLAREMGHHDVWLHVRSSDPIAVGLYAASGYEETSGGGGGAGGGGGGGNPFAKMFGGGGDKGDKSGVVLMRKAL